LAESGRIHKLSRWLFPVAITFLSAGAWAQPSQSPVADTMIVNARIYTVNPKQPWAEALAIGGDKILAVGTAKEIAGYRSPSTHVMDVQQRLVLPGFTDCHIHFLDGSLSLLQVNLDDTRTVSEIQTMVKAFADAHPDLPWVLGRGWNYAVFNPLGLPDKRYLDQIIPDRPVYLESFDGHTWWANSKALMLAGIGKGPANPPGGEFVRDPKSGEPTGTIKEDAADEVVRKAIPEPGHQEIVDALIQGMHEANRFGLVRAISPDGTHVQGGDFGVLEIYDELRRQGQLTVRFQIAARLQPPVVTDTEVKKIEDARRRYHDEWISAGAAKFFLDGVIESHTAAMLTPYSDDPKQTGSLLWTPDNYKRAVIKLDAAHIQIFTHAIGDRAVRLALDAYREAQNSNHTRDARDRIEHIETISAEDIPRFGKLGVIPSFQPLHAYPDEDLLKVWLPKAGAERAQRGFAWHSVAQDGGVLAFGSDWPIVTLSPWPGVQNALTRQTNDGDPPGGFLPGERVSLEDAIKAYTLGAAFAGLREKTEGSLEPGKLADLIVLSQDLFKIKPSQVSNTDVLLTMVGGKVVYRAQGWTPAAETK
jgi:predicted amidohydrolase YtcJ